MSDGVMAYPIRRAGVWGPPACWMMFSLILVVGVPGVGSKLFYLAMSALSGLWFVRALRCAVIVSDDVVVVRGQFRTRTFAKDTIREASRQRMRTASPFRDAMPYLALSLGFTDGRTRQFGEISAAARDNDGVEAIIDAINAEL